MDDRIDRALQTLRGCANPPAVSAVAASAGLSARRFSEIFKHEIGLPPRRYAKQVRLEAARRLLETTQLNVKQVMAEAGYSDRSHFSRDFAKLFGFTPGEYRRRGGSKALEQPD